MLTRRQFLADDIGSEDLEDMYKECHAKIREDPAAQITDKADLAKWKVESRKTHPLKLSLVERRARVAAKKEAWTAARAEAVEADDEE